MQQSTITLEACVESLEEAIHAEHKGAHRLELCANLDQDGTTPGEELIRSVIEAVGIPVKVMVRPRGGNFIYSAREFEEMLDTIQLCHSLGIPGIVTGVLRTDMTLDIPRLRHLAQAASPMTVTVHKCIDEVPDVFAAIDSLKQETRVTHILSSGGKETAVSGAAELSLIRQWCKPNIELIVAGRVTQEVLPDLIRDIQATEYHGRRIV